MIKKAIIKKKLGDESMWEYAKQEADIHKQLSNNENVVRLYESKETPESYDMYMEYCDKGDAFANKILEVSVDPGCSLIQILNNTKMADSNYLAAHTYW